MPDLSTLDTQNYLSDIMRRIQSLESQALKPKVKAGAGSTTNVTNNSATTIDAQSGLVRVDPYPTLLTETFVASSSYSGYVTASALGVPAGAIAFIVEVSSTLNDGLSGSGSATFQGSVISGGSKQMLYSYAADTGLADPFGFGTFQSLLFCDNTQGFHWYATTSNVEPITFTVTLIGYITNLSGSGGGGGGGGSTTFAGLSDVDASSVVDGDVMVYVGGTAKYTMLAMSGDVTIDDTGATTLATVNLAPGSGGAANFTTLWTVNPKGLVTALSSTPIAIAASQIVSGILSLVRGGTGADLSGTGGANQVVKQTSVGGALAPSLLVPADIPNLDTSKLTTGQLALARGGTHKDLSATGGAHQFVAQDTVGGDLTPRVLTSGDLPAGTGTVTSVGLTMPSVFDVGGSPVTTVGTLAVTFDPTQAANQGLFTPDNAVGAFGPRVMVPRDWAASPVLGSIPYAQSATVNGYLGPNTTAIKKFLRETGTGSAGTAPTWDTVTPSDVTGLVGILLWDTTTAYTVGMVVKSSTDGNYYRCIASTTNNDPTTDAFSKWELFKVTSEVSTTTTLNWDGSRFPQTAAGLQAAVNFVKKATIDPACRVNISMSAASVAMSTTTIQANMLCGSRVFLIGDTSTPANVTLTWTGSVVGFIVTNGYWFNIDGVKLVGSWTGSGTTGLSQTGVFFQTGAGGVVGPHVAVDKFYYAVQAAGGGTSATCSGITVTNGGDVGLFAYQGGVLIANNCTVSGCSDSTNSLGSGMGSEQHGFIDCTGSSCTTCRVAGFYVGANSQALISNCTADGNTGVGYRSLWNGHFTGVGAISAQNNGGDGIVLFAGSWQSAGGGTVNVTGNGGNGVDMLQGSVAIIGGLTASGCTGAGVKVYGGSKLAAIGAVLGSSGHANATGADVDGTSLMDFGGSGTIAFNTVGVKADNAGLVKTAGVTFTSNTTDWSPNAAYTINQPSAGVGGQLIKAAASPTTPPWQIQDSSGNVVASQQGSVFAVMNSGAVNTLRNGRKDYPGSAGLGVGNYNIAADVAGVVTTAAIFAFTSAEAWSSSAVGVSWSISWCKKTTNTRVTGLTGDSEGDIYMPATSGVAATDGYFRGPTVAGFPTGAPTRGSGTQVWDSTHNALCIYNGSAWVLQSGGSFSTPTVTATTYTMALGEVLCKVNPNITVTIAVTLPTAANYAGKMVTVLKLGATGTCTVASGSGTATLTAAFSEASFVSDGTTWYKTSSI